MILPPRGRSTSIGVKPAAAPPIHGHPAARDSPINDGFVHRRSPVPAPRCHRAVGPDRRRSTAYEGATHRENAPATRVLRPLLGWQTRYDDETRSPATAVSTSVFQLPRCTNYEGADAPIWAAEARNGSSPVTTSRGMSTRPSPHPSSPPIQTNSMYHLQLPVPTPPVAESTHRPIVSLGRTDYAANAGCLHQTAVGLERWKQ